MRQLLILISIVVKITLCHCQEYAQLNILDFKGNNIHHQTNVNNHVMLVKNESTMDMVEYEFASETNYTNQLFVNLNTKASTNLSIIDVLSSNKYISVDHEMFSITMKDKNELILYINDVKMQVSNFQMYQLLNGMKAFNIKTIEVINVPEYRSNISNNTGIIKIKKK